MVGTPLNVYISEQDYKLFKDWVEQNLLSRGVTGLANALYV